MCDLVSIIIPLYNVEQYVEVSLKSAFNQTFADIEYLLIDDCSTDQTMEVVKRLIMECSRCNSVKIVHHEKNRGLSAARNTGMKYANGDFIFFMDSDDEIVPDCIEKHYEALRRADADFTIANICLEGAKSIHIKPIPDEVKNIPLKISYFKRMWNISACNKLYRRHFLEENELTFQEGLLHEDILWAYQLSCKAQKVAFVEEATYIYKIHQGSITTGKNGNRKIESLLYILRFMDNDKKNNISDSLLRTYYCMFDFWRLSTAMLLLDYNGTNKEAKLYYAQLGKFKHKSYNNIYSLILKLPFGIYKNSIGLLYRLYKRFQ